MRYYLSGVEPRHRGIFSAPLPNGGVMVNATHLHLPAVRAMCDAFSQRGIPLVLDSGMIQGIISEDAYIELLCRFGGSWFTWFAHYDVPGSLALSNANYNELRDYLPVALHERLLYVLQGEPARGLTEPQYRSLVRVLSYATPYIGIGGLAGYCRKGKYEVIERYLGAIYARLGREVCRHVHLFGIGNYRLLRKYRHMFGSADSSTWLCGVRGDLLQAGGGRRRVGLDPPYDREGLLRQNIETVQGWGAVEEVQLPLFACASPVVDRPRFHSPEGVDPYLLSTFDEPREWGMEGMAPRKGMTQQPGCQRHTLSRGGMGASHRLERHMRRGC